MLRNMLCCASDLPAAPDLDVLSQNDRLTPQESPHLVGSRFPRVEEMPAGGPKAEGFR
jgi:hypothetical protein